MDEWKNDDDIPLFFNPDGIKAENLIFDENESFDICEEVKRVIQKEVDVMEAMKYFMYRLCAWMETDKAFQKKLDIHRIIQVLYIRHDDGFEARLRKHAKDMIKKPFETYLKKI